MFNDLLPELVVNRALSLGSEGQAWLNKLDDIAQRMLSAHQLTWHAVMRGGTESLVLDATTKSGQDVVVKIGLPGSANLNREANVYAFANGKGYARLVYHNEADNALILEKLGAPLESESRPDHEVIDILCRTMQSSWIQLSESKAQELALMNGAEKAQWHIDHLSQCLEQKNKRCSNKTIDVALDYAHQRMQAFTPEESVLVHGDAHSLNTLTDPNGDYKFIDPDGLFAEPAMDLAIPMREFNTSLLSHNTLALAIARCERLSQLTLVDPEPIWQWGMIERVSTGFVLLELGMEQEGNTTLEIAETLHTHQF